MLQPLLRGLEWQCLETALVDSTVHLTRDETGTLEDTNVPRYGGQGHGKRRSQLRDHGGRFGQACHQDATSPVTQCMEHGVQLILDGPRAATA
jgi:hypothetical protein